MNHSGRTKKETLWTENALGSPPTIIASENPVEEVTTTILGRFPFLVFTI